MNSRFTRKVIAIWAGVLVLGLSLVAVVQAQLGSSTYLPLVVHEPTHTLAPTVTPRAPRLSRPPPARRR